MRLERVALAALIAAIGALCFPSQVAASVAVDLRVACRKGQPPFIDAPLRTAASCQGLIFDAFTVIMARSNWTYNMTVIESSTLDPFIQVDPVTGQSQFDLILAFHTITPTRLKVHDFSVSLTQSDDTVELSPKFQKSGGDLVGAVIRKAVLYVFSIFALTFMAMAIVTLIFEHLHDDSDLLRVPMWQRFLHALQCGVETVFTASSTLNLSGQTCRSIRSILACLGAFIISIFGAVLTSQLTTASVRVISVPVTDLAGARIAIASSTLTPYLTGKQVGATVLSVPNLEVFASEWYSGLHTDVDGYCTSTEVVSYIHNKYGAAKKGYTETPNFRKSGTYELKGLPMSLNLLADKKNTINRELQTMRENGQLSTLMLKYVKDAEQAPPPDDVPVAPESLNFFASFTAIVFGLLIVASLVMLVRHKLFDSPAAADDAGAQSTLVWGDTTYGDISDSAAAVLDSIVKYAREATPTPAAGASS